MAAKKSFKGTDNAVLKYISASEEDSATTQNPHDTHDAQNTHDAHDAQNTHDAHDAQNTSNMPIVADPKRKQKHIRINMAFYEDHHEYLSYISRLQGISITQYVNNLIAVDKSLNQDTIEKAKDFFK